MARRLEDGLISFTDGSKTSDGTGAGALTLEPRDEEWFNLGSLASVFQAETFAALKGLLKLLPAGVEGKKAFPDSSDSEAMIKALMSPVTTLR